MSITGQFITRSAEETFELGQKIGEQLNSRTVFLLSGDLGAGKTVFAKGVAEGLDIDSTEVTSPTFTLVHEYRGGRLPLVHVDLYRLDRADLDEIGLDQDLALTGVVAIEWPDRLTRAISGATSIRIADEGGDRRAIAIG